ncbi:MAG: hypothetical protein WKF77_00870 [Planctomycetaceae bacterium]
MISRWAAAIRAVVTDDDGKSGEGTVTQEVNNVTPTVTLEPSSTNTNPAFISLKAVVTDPGIRDTISVTWTATPVGGPSTASQSGTLTTSNLFQIDRTAAPTSVWKVSVTAKDDDGGTTLFESALLVGTNGNDTGVNRLIVTNATFTNAGTQHLMALALDGDDTIDATGVTDPRFSVVLVGGAGKDDRYGGAGDDVYYLAQGNDNANVPYAGGPTPVEAGDDRYVLRPNSILTVIDKGGENSLEFGLADIGITFDLSLVSTTTMTTQDVLPVEDQDPIHEVRTLGTFTELIGSTFDDTLTGDSDATVSGGAGDDEFRVSDNTVNATFYGGADDDIMTISASTTGISGLNFGGDAGLDQLFNFGNITGLTFNGGADADIFQNLGTVLGNLNFGGDGGLDALFNTGSISSLVFTGGADADIFLSGGADDDILLNDGPVIASLVFTGDAGNDTLWNRKGGIQVGSIVFTDDLGIDVLVNDAAGILNLTFTGGADGDVLQNNGFVTNLKFTGGADADVLVNSGTVTVLTFGGGADDDILLNRGTQVDVLNFYGDGGLDLLFNLGAVTTLTFSGGADDDILVNSAPVASLVFFGHADGPETLDDGADTLVNNAAVTTLTFSGGADDDILQNNATVVSLTFLGGGDDDVLVNNGRVLTLLSFSGDAGADTLINNAGGVGRLFFTGGADGDTLRVHGRDLGSVTFHGGTGTDSFTYNGVGTAASIVTFLAGPGNDFFAMRGAATTVSYDGGEGNDSAMIVGSGTMTLTGGDGDDLVRFVSNPLADVTLTDSYSGINDTSKDTLDFSSFAGGAVNLDLRLMNVWQSQGNGQLRIRLTDGMAFENIIGSQFADTIYGNPRNNYIGGADFDDAFTGPVASTRGETQWVLLDFVSYTNTGLTDTVTGLPDAGEHVYIDRNRTHSPARGSGLSRTERRRSVV